MVYCGTLEEVVHRERERRGAGEVRRRKPTREVCSSAPDRTIYGSRCRDLIGQPEWGLGVLISWEPHARTLARAVFPERSEVADALISGVH